MWKPVALPKLPGRIVAVSEPDGHRLAVWTTDGVFILEVEPRVELLERLPAQRGLQCLDKAEGYFRWREDDYRMHGLCGPQGEGVGEPLPLIHRLGMRLEWDGNRLLVYDVAGKLRQAIAKCPTKAHWLVAGFCAKDHPDAGYDETYLLLAHPRSIRLFRFVGSPEGAGALWQRTGSARQQHAFLRAILDSPDEDTPRLVYADWLEEQGDPQRAEFIRLQCRIAQHEQLADLGDGDPDHRREWQLGYPNMKRWEAELPILPGANYNFYQAFRGFPLVDLQSPEILLRHGKRLLAATPIEAVSIQQLSRQLLARLLKAPYLEHVCRLVIKHLPADARPLLTEWLMSPRAGRLRRLLVPSGPSGATWKAVLRAVAASRHLARLEKLESEGFARPGRVRDEDEVLAVARSSHLPRLRAVEGFWPDTYSRRAQAELRKRFRD